MTHLISNPHYAAENSVKNILEAKGVHTYSFPTLDGERVAALNVNPDEIKTFPGITENCRFVQVKTAYILASREIKPEPTIIRTRFGKAVGNGKLTVIAGPCSIESEAQIIEAALAVKKAGAGILRGGAYKPRSCPYAFQGTGEKGLRLLREAGDRARLPIITELMDADDLPLLTEYADIIQIGARNCQNYSLLKKAGKIKKPVLLKRGLSCTIEELLLSAEYILAGGNMDVILCERGIRTFEQETRNTLDISAVPVLKHKTHLPVVVDPSHAAGYWRFIEPLTLAAVASGVDGLMIEVHPDPDSALCDGRQSLKPEKFEKLMEHVRVISRAFKRLS